MPRLLLALAFLLALAGCRGSDDDDVARYGGKPDYGVKPSAETSSATTASAASDAFSERDLVGTWRISAFISPEETARLSDDPIPPGTEVEATIQGTIDYLASGEYDGEVELVYRVRANGQEVPLRFQIDSQGTWELDGDILREVTVDESVSPADALTAEAVSGDPGFGASLASSLGEESEARILSHSASSVELVELGSDLQLTLRR